MTKNYVPTKEELAKRYPRLVRSMRWAACLTTGEALGALYMHKIGDNWAGEAVNHYGGVAEVLKGAVRCRHIVRRAYKSAGQRATHGRHTIPPLEPHCGSWVVVDRSTGKAILETFSRSVAEAINQARFEVLTTLQWLGRVNAR